MILTSKVPRTAATVLKDEDIHDTSLVISTSKNGDSNRRLTECQDSTEGFGASNNKFCSQLRDMKPKQVEKECEVGPDDATKDQCPLSCGE